MRDASLRRWLTGDPTPASGRSLAVLVVAVVSAGALLWCLRYDVGFRGLSYPDAHDYAQLGRQLHRGEGFSSQQTFPYVLGWLKSHDLPTEPPWPNVTRPPLITLLNALSYGLVGPGDLAVVLPGGVLLVAAGVATLLLGNRFFGPLAGLVAALLVVSSPTQLRFSITGLAESGAAFFVTATALALAIACDSTRRRGVLAFVLGVVAGLAFLQRANLVVLLPIVVVLHWFGSRERSVAATGALIAGIAVSTGPWLLRNLIFFGTPLVSLTGDRALLVNLVPGDPFYAFTQYDRLEMVRDHASNIFERLTSGWHITHFRELFGLEFAWLGPAFLLSAAGIRTRPIAVLWLFGAASFAASGILLLATYNEARYYHPLAPLLLALVIGSAIGLVRKLPSWAHAACPVLAAALVLLSVLPSLIAPTAPTLDVRPDRQQLDELAGLLPPEAIVASNTSWKLAWYGDRRSVRFLGAPAQLEILDRDYVGIDAVYMEGPRTDSFRRALESSPIAGRFREAHRFPNGALWLAQPDDR